MVEDQVKWKVPADTALTRENENGWFAMLSLCHKLELPCPLHLPTPAPSESVKSSSGFQMHILITVTATPDYIRTTISTMDSEVDATGPEENKSTTSKTDSIQVDQDDAKVLKRVRFQVK